MHDSWKSRATQSWPINRISWVDWSSGMMRGSIAIQAWGSNDAVIKDVPEQDGRVMVEQVRSMLSGYQTASPQPGYHPVTPQYPHPPQPGYPAPAHPGPVAGAAPPAPSAEPDVMEQLRQLGELHQSGVLTDEEFNAKKAELLGRL